jgi:hypothetical protein
MLNLMHPISHAILNIIRPYNLVPTIKSVLLVTPQPSNHISWSWKTKVENVENEIRTIRYRSGNEHTTDRRSRNTHAAARAEQIIRKDRGQKINTSRNGHKPTTRLCLYYATSCTSLASHRSRTLTFGDTKARRSLSWVEKFC